MHANLGRQFPYFWFHRPPQPLVRAPAPSWLFSNNSRVFVPSILLLPKKASPCKLNLPRFPDRHFKKERQGFPQLPLPSPLANSTVPSEEYPALHHSISLQELLPAQQLLNSVPHILSLTSLHFLDTVDPLLQFLPSRFLFGSQSSRSCAEIMPKHFNTVKDPHSHFLAVFLEPFFYVRARRNHLILTALSSFIYGDHQSFFRDSSIEFLEHFIVTSGTVSSAIADIIFPHFSSFSTIFHHFSSFFDFFVFSFFQCFPFFSFFSFFVFFFIFDFFVFHFFNVFHFFIFSVFPFFFVFVFLSFFSSPAPPRSPTGALLKHRSLLQKY